jgi:hypothetical protein
MLGEDWFGLRRGKVTRDANGVLRIISERIRTYIKNRVLASQTVRKNLTM